MPASVNFMNLPKLKVSDEPPYDALQAFCRINHRAMEGRPGGPLSGLAFAAKDVLSVMGSTVGNGHPEWLSHHEPDKFTSSIIVRLLDAGADLVGKTICDELCFSISGENWQWGSPINPQDPRRFTGGSSAGSGAATAAGLCDFALGTDCLGSVRVPSAYCGLLGIRPTYHRVPSDGEAPYCISMDVLGYMAREPEVFRRVAPVMLGEDEKKVKPRKVYIAADNFGVLDEDVQKAFRPVIDWVASQVGDAEEIEVAGGHIADWIQTFRKFQGWEVWESYGGWYNQYHPKISKPVLERVLWTSTITRNEYYEAFEQRKPIIARIDEIVADGGILLIPTASSVAPLKSITEEDMNRLRGQSMKSLVLSPLSGCPQVNIPLAEMEDVPLGISVIGARGTDTELCRFAADLVDAYRKQA